MIAKPIDNGATGLPFYNPRRIDAVYDSLSADEAIALLTGNEDDYAKREKDVRVSFVVSMTPDEKILVIRACLESEVALERLTTFVPRPQNVLELLEPEQES